jgi:hypothetical protein
MRLAEAIKADEAEGHRTDIRTVFSKDPEAMTALDRARIIAFYRRLRTDPKEFDPKAFEPKTGEPKKKPPKRKASRVDPRQIDMDLIAGEDDADSVL